MAGGNTVTLTFAGDDRNLSRVLAGLRGKTQSAEDGLRTFGTISALAVPALGYTAGAVVGLSGALGVLPSMAFAGGLALGALAIGVSGFGEAMSSMDDPAKFAEAIGKLAPEARSTAVAIRDLRPQFDGLKAAVQDKLFTGMAGELRTLTGALLPTLQGQLVATAGSINSTGRAFAGWMSTPSTVTDINTALGGSQRFLDGLLASLLPVSAAFLDIGVVAAPYMDRMGASILNASVRFRDFISAARESGQLGEWIGEGLAVFQQLWQVIKDLGAVIVNLGLAFESAGLPNTLQLISGGLRTVSEFIRDNATVMVPLITGLGLLVVAFKAIMGVVGIINAVRNATMLWTAAQWLFNAALWANPITWVVIGIIALIAAIVLCIVYWDEIKAAAVGAIDWIVGKWNQGVALLSGIWAAIKAVATAAWNYVTAWIRTKVAQAIGFIRGLAAIPGMVGAWFGQMKDRAVAKASELVGWVRGLPGRIRSALGNLGSLLLSAGRDLVNGLWNGIKAGWSWITGAVRDLASSLLSAAKSALGIASPSKLFRDEIGRWIPEGMAVGITANTDGLIKSARDLADLAVAAATPTGPSGSAAALSGIRGRSAAAAAPVQVVVHVAGSIRSDRELVSLIRDEMDRGGFRGVRS